MLNQIITDPLKSTTEPDAIAHSGNELPISPSASSSMATHTSNTIQRIPKKRLLQLLPPAVAYLYGQAYSGLLAREIFTKGYELYYGIPDFDCGYTLLCYGKDAAEYYGCFLPARELAGQYGTLYGPSVMFALAYIAPSLAQYSYHLTSKATNHLYQQTMKAGRSLLHSYQSRKNKTQQPPELNAQVSNTHTVVVFPKIEELILTMNQDLDEKDFSIDSTISEFSQLSQNQEALNLEGVILNKAKKSSAINLRKSI